MSGAGPVVPFLPPIPELRPERPLDHSAAAAVWLRRLSHLILHTAEHDVDRLTELVHAALGGGENELAALIHTLRATVEVVAGTLQIGDPREPALARLVTNLGSLAFLARMLRGGRTPGAEPHASQALVELARRLEPPLLVVERLVLPLACRRFSRGDSHRLARRLASPPSA